MRQLLTSRIEFAKTVCRPLGKARPGRVPRERVGRAVYGLAALIADRHEDGEDRGVEARGGKSREESAIDHDRTDSLEIAAQLHALGPNYGVDAARLMPRAAAREREKGLGMERETREAATGYRELMAGFVVPLGVSLQRPGRGRGARCLGDGRGWLWDSDGNP